MGLFGIKNVLKLGEMVAQHFKYSELDWIIQFKVFYAM